MKIEIFKDRNSKMWHGFCYGCGHTWQFWFFGATLGFGLEHQRQCIIRNRRMLKFLTDNPWLMGK